MTLLEVSVIEAMPWMLVTAVVTALIAFWRFRKKDKASVMHIDANTAQVLVKTAGELVEQAREQCEATANDLAESNKELGIARKIIADLQEKLDARTKEQHKCARQVEELSKRIQELTEPDRRRPRPNNE